MIGRMRKNKRVARAACTPEQFHASSAKQKRQIPTDMCVQKALVQAVIKLLMLSLPNIAASGQVAIVNQKWSSKMLHYKHGII